MHWLVCYWLDGTDGLDWAFVELEWYGGNNVSRRLNGGFFKHLRVSSKHCPAGLAIRKAKNWPWGWSNLNPKQRRQHNIQQKIKRKTFWRHSPFGEGEIISAQVTEDVSF